MSNNVARRPSQTSSVTETAGAVAKLQSAVRRKKIALIGTAVYPLSHTQHFLDRFLLGYTWDSAWHRPAVDLVSLYIDQFPNNDLARSTAKRHNVPIFPTVEDALTLGGSNLAVDGVVIIGEHGVYPRNDKGQWLYPRFKFFKQVVGVFESTGRSVPVFHDKHLSTEWSDCVEMVNDSKRLQFPFLAGSALPVTRRMPAIDMPYGASLLEAVCAGYGRMDSYDFHGLETLQCMSERRHGGEVGIRSVHAMRGGRMWNHVANREITQKLLVAALTRSHNLPAPNGYPSDSVSFDWMRKSFPDGWAYFIEHREGLRTSLFMLDIHDFNYAGILANGEIVSCQMYLPMPGHGSTTADFFNPLVRHIEQMIVDNRSPYPAERTLLTSGMTLAGVDSFYRGEQVVETPEMDVRYTVGAESLFWTV
ncbi:MAG TPA: hypothetical protein VFW73_10565 [Lacipirellulaceae bacterium]|nr:hypothetical protein [Lacipirellulaceae bacterium]